MAGILLLKCEKWQPILLVNFAAALDCTGLHHWSRLCNFVFSSQCSSQSIGSMEPRAHRLCWITIMRHSLVMLFASTTIVIVGSFLWNEVWGVILPDRRFVRPPPENRHLFLVIEKHFNLTSLVSLLRVTWCQELSLKDWPCGLMAVSSFPELWLMVRLTPPSSRWIRM